MKNKGGAPIGNKNALKPGGERAKMKSFRLPPEHLAMLEEIAEARGMKQTAVIKMGIEAIYKA